MSRFLIISALAALTLSGCSSAKDQLGLTRESPDEFAIVKRAPLEMPTGHTLPKPRPGAARPQERAVSAQTRDTVLGAQQNTAQPTPSSAESTLLQQAGAYQTDPSIRQAVDTETSKIAPKEQAVVDKLFGWTRSAGDEPAATIVDAEAEAARLKENQEAGKAVTEGETPSIEE